MQLWKVGWLNFGQVFFSTISASYWRTVLYHYCAMHFLRNPCLWSYCTGKITDLHRRSSKVDRPYFVEIQTSYSFVNSFPLYVQHWTCGWLNLDMVFCHHQWKRKNTPQKTCGEIWKPSKNLFNKRIWTECIVGTLDIFSRMENGRRM